VVDNWVVEHVVRIASYAIHIPLAQCLSIKRNIWIRFLRLTFWLKKMLSTLKRRPESSTLTRWSLLQHTNLLSHPSRYCLPSVNWDLSQRVTHQHRKWVTIWQSILIGKMAEISIMRDIPNIPTILFLSRVTQLIRWTSLRSRWSSSRGSSIWLNP